MANFLERIFGRKATYGGGRGYNGGTSFIRVHDAIDGYHGARGKKADVYGNSAVAACIGYVAKTVTEPPLCVFVDNAEGEREKVDSHLIERLLADPSESCTGSQLLQSTAISLLLAGNAYWRLTVVDGGLGLEWLPNHMIEPRGKGYNDDSELSHYELKTSSGTFEVDPEEIVHFKHADLDPQNRLLGRNPFKAALVEVMSDDEATVYTHSILRNYGIPGLLVGVDAPGMTEEEKTDLKRKFWQATTGSRRGEPLVHAKDGMEVTEVGVSPDKMAIDQLRRVPEERICAVLGVPPMLVGLSLGNNAKYANIKEAREDFTERTLVPLWGRLAETIEQTLLPLQPVDGAYVAFDTSNVAALQEDKSDAYKRAAEMYKAGVFTRAQAMRHVGLNASDAEEYTIHEAIAKTRMMSAAEAGIKALANRANVRKPN